MGERGPRCACGEVAAADGQLVCRACYTPYALLAPERRRGVRLEFDGGCVEIAAGEQVVLGRAGGGDPRLGFLADETRYDHLSRAHATVRVDDEGRAWVRDEHSTNRTYLHDRELAPGEWLPLRVGDPLRLASDVRVRIRGLEP
ncbi:FHA domain-containing protein [Streptomyces sp. NPDC060194]|uniref:FHA domain-containing protein n=1 Tax=Streptomyces sp. NPDC060194 TaxID=3347069 RepID=UPI003664C4F5